MLCSYDDLCYIICTVLHGRYCVIQHSCCNTNKTIIVQMHSDLVLENIVYGIRRIWRTCLAQQTILSNSLNSDSKSLPTPSLSPLLAYSETRHTHTWLNSFILPRAARAYKYCSTTYMPAAEGLSSPPSSALTCIKLPISWQYSPHPQITGRRFYHLFDILRLAGFQL